MKWFLAAVRRGTLLLLVGFIPVASLSAQSSNAALTRIALFEPAGHSSDPTLAAVLSTVADSVELSLVVLQRYDVRRLPPADPDTDLPKVRAYCEANHIDQAILGSGAERPEGGFAFRLLVYDRKSDAITIDKQGSSTGALDMFDTTDTLVASLLDGLSGTHLLFGSLTVDTDPPAATISVNGRDAGPGPLSLRGLPVGTVQLAARAPGREDASASVTIVDGETASASLKLARSMGKLAVQVPTDALVTVASAEIGQEQLSGPGSLELPTGDYQLTAVSPGLSPVTAQLTVGRNATEDWLPWTKGYLVVQATPDGAAITVDGVARGTAPQLIEVDPGVAHQVRLAVDDYSSYTTSVIAKAGTKIPVSGSLDPLPGAVYVDSSIPGANVILDGSEVATAPHNFSNVAAGTHVVVINDIVQNGQIYSVGGPIQIVVEPGKTTSVVKRFGIAAARLVISDAPPGSTIQVDGQSLDPVLAAASGVDVTAGKRRIVVLEPSGRKWAASLDLAANAVVKVSVSAMGLQPERRTISMKGNAADWAGLAPVWTSPSNLNTWDNQPGTKIVRAFICRDDHDLYLRYEFGDGTPIVKIANGFKELDYIQTISTNAGDVTAIVKFMRSIFGSAQATLLGIQKSARWTDLAGNRVRFRIGDSSLEVSIPLDLIEPYVKGDPRPVALHVVNADPDNNGQWLNYNSTERRLIDFGP